MSMFDYDWWHGQPLQQQIEHAKLRCAQRKFPDVDPSQPGQDSDFARFKGVLEARILVYLRDGFSYEIAEMVELGPRSYLTVECVPGDDAYRVGTFVVAIPFEDIVRVEVFAVHPTEKPSDSPHITGFRAAPDSPPPRD
ncbi:MAG TPA: hypothetical protein VMZ31_01935 [Phycisphaerae bacterium]|nr:hypothetical protein [Phycisphaerae bacterium]